MRRSSQIRYITFTPGAQQPGGLIGRVVALIIGLAAFVAAVFVGAIFLAGLVGLLLIGSVIFMLRVWWLQRQMDKEARTTGDLEGQYTVISEADPASVGKDDHQP